MPTDRKIQQVQALRDKLDRCTIAIATDPTGLNVNNINELRKLLRSRNVEYRVIKNTLAYIAADGSKTTNLGKIVKGPTGLAFGYDDPVLVAQALEEFTRVSRTPLNIRGGCLGDRILTATDISTLATLPPRDQILATLLGQAQAPITRLVGQLQTPLSKLVNVLGRPLSNLTLVLHQRVEQLKS